MLYTPDSFRPGQVQPTSEQLAGYATSLKNTFNLANIDFIVNYYHDATSNPSIVDLQKNGPIFSINLHEQRLRDSRNQCGEFFIRLDDREFYMIDFSCDQLSGKCDIGFVTNSVFNVGDHVNIPFRYGGFNLDGEYTIKRIAGALPGLPYIHFIGAEKTL